MSITQVVSSIVADGPHIGNLAGRMAATPGCKYLERFSLGKDKINV